MKVDSFSLGFALKLAEAGVPADRLVQAIDKKAADSDKEPSVSRRAYEMIYEKTRGKLRREADRSQVGRGSLLWQGFRNPVTGKFRFPISFGSKKVNDEIASMTPAQANFVSLLTKYKNLKNHFQVQKKSRQENGDFEFLGDPTVFNSRSSRLTSRGLSDFRKAYKYVNKVDPGDEYAKILTSKLFGENAGFDGSPHIFETVNRRRI